MPTSYLWLIPLLPFAGFLINGTIGRKLPRALVTAVALLCTAIPAGIVAWLWATMKAAGAPESSASSADPSVIVGSPSPASTSTSRSPSITLPSSCSASSPE